MNRVNNSAKYLKGIVQNGKTFYIGFGSKTLTDAGKAYKDLTDLINGKKTSIIVTGKKGIFKENTSGKYVRKQPESKKTIVRHINYFSNRFQKEIDYDREFNIWDKEILHKYNLTLEVAKTPQGETIFHFPALKLKDNVDVFLRAGVAMNMSIILSSYFMIYDNVFEPIIPVTKTDQKKILASGNVSVTEKLDIIKDDIDRQGTDEISEGNSYRFASLKEKNPSDVTIGLGGFDEYLRFEYEEDDLVVLENLKTGNATFLFTLSQFNASKELNKKNASSDPAFLKRIIHNNPKDWSKQFNRFFRN